MVALIKGRDKEVVSLLANAGSRLLSKDKAGYVPMGLSLLAGGYDTVRSFLATTLKQLIPALVDPARDWRFFPLEELRDLVRRGASLEAIGLDGRNALHFACIGKAGGKHVDMGDTALGTKAAEVLLEQIQGTLPVGSGSHFIQDCTLVEGDTVNDITNLSKED